MLQRLVKGYYEIHGNFDDIMSSKISRLLIDKNISENDLYVYIGFNDVKNFTAKDIYNIRKSILQNEIKDEKELKSKLKILSDANQGISEDLLNQSETKKDKYVKILNKYLMADVNLIRGGKDFRELLNELINLNQTDLSKTLNLAGFREYYDSLLPAWKYVKDCEPCIQLGTFYIPDKLTEKEQHLIIQTSLKDVIFGSSSVGESYALSLRKSLTKPITFSSCELYRSVIDLALASNLTIKDLISNCNINHIDILEQWSNYRCLFYIEKNNTKSLYLVVYNIKDDITKTVYISDFQFKFLYERDLLTYLTVINDEVCIDKGGITPLSDILRG